MAGTSRVTTEPLGIGGWEFRVSITQREQPSGPSDDWNLVSALLPVDAFQRVPDLGAPDFEKILCPRGRCR